MHDTPGIEALVQARRVFPAKIAPVGIVQRKAIAIGHPRSMSERAPASGQFGTNTRPGERRSGKISALVAAGKDRAYRAQRRRFVKKVGMTATLHMHQRAIGQRIGHLLGLLP